MNEKTGVASDVTLTTGRFNIAAIAASLPATATTLLVDPYLTDREAASASSSSIRRTARLKASFRKAARAPIDARGDGNGQIDFSGRGPVRRASDRRA
jgi:hypothetical protein